MAENEEMFHGVPLGWMQAYWRDCRNKKAQLKIFKDMTGAGGQEILDALGERDFVLTEAPPRKKFTTQDDDTIIRMWEEGATASEIGNVIGRTDRQVQARIQKLRRKGVTVQKGVGHLSPVAVTVERVNPAEPVPEICGPAVPVDGLGAAENELRELIEQERNLLYELDIVRTKTAEYKKRLGELLAMAGGGLT